jgi:sugar phosphate isomerase/epimerase
MKFSASAGAIAGFESRWGVKKEAIQADGRGGKERRTQAAFNLGIASYTFREFNLDEAIVMTKRVGLRHVCLKDFHLPLDSSQGQIEAIIEKIQKADLNPYGCGVVYMRSGEDVERAFAYAQSAGVEVIVGVPEHRWLPLAEKRAAESEIKLAIHNHGPGDPVYPTPQSALEKIKGMDAHVGICLDIGHCMRSGIDPSEAAEECADRLHDVHLKDVTAPTKKGSAVEVGRGVIDIPKFLHTLVRLHYAGTAAFEYEKDGKDPLPGLAESVGYVKAIMRLLSSSSRIHDSSRVD